jgi:hypothetical protein
MKKLPYLLVITLALLTIPVKAQVDLAFFGTNSSPFEVDGGFTDAGYTQASSTLTFTIPFTSGQTLFGAFGSLASPISFNWTNQPGLALVLSSTNAPNVFLNVDFYAADLTTTLDSGTIALGSVVASPAPVQIQGLTLSNLNGVGALFFTWGGDSVSGDGAITLHSVQSIPEPSTYALLALSSLAFGGYVIRRRRRV